MAYVEIPNSYEYGPYSAIIGYDPKVDGDDNIYGEIRIEPPVSLGEQLLEEIHDEGLTLKSSVSDSRATTYSFYQPAGSEAQTLTLEKVHDLTKYILERLGNVSSTAKFKEEWGRF